ncbi:hypothetical protein [Nakamurella antarctica]|nr:hypothetical protein [Nakamurella antarctica]
MTLTRPLFALSLTSVIDIGLSRRFRNAGSWRFRNAGSRGAGEAAR